MQELICPYTGAPVEVRQVGGGFVGRVSVAYGGYTTRIFETYSQLENFCRRRNGKLVGARLAVVNVSEPPLVEDVESKERDAERDADEIAQIGAEKVVRSLRGARD